MFAGECRTFMHGTLRLVLDGVPRILRVGLQILCDAHRASAKIGGSIGEFVFEFGDGFHGFIFLS